MWGGLHVQHYSYSWEFFNKNSCTMSEKYLLVSEQRRSKPGLHHLYPACGWTHPPPIVPPFLLTQNLHEKVPKQCHEHVNTHHYGNLHFLHHVRTAQFKHFTHALWVVVRCETGGASEAIPAVAEASEASKCIVQLEVDLCIRLSMERQTLLTKHGP